MANLQIHYNNFADRGTYSGGSWESSLPLSNAKHPQISKVARSTDATEESTQFVLDLGEARELSGIFVGPGNFSADASYRMRLYADEAQENLLWDSGVKEIYGIQHASLDLEWEDDEFWSGSVPIRELQQNIWLMEFISSGPIGQYLKIEIFDEDNEDGFVGFGRVFIGEKFEPTRNYAYGNNGLSHESLTQREQALSGARYFWNRRPRRTFRCAFDYLPEDEAYKHVYRLARIAGTGRQVFLVPDPADSLYVQNRSFLGTLRDLPPIEQVAFKEAATAFAIDEVL